MFIHRKPEAVPELTTQNEDRAISFEILREYVHGYNNDKAYSTQL
jgi:hypothetical protein